MKLRYLFAALLLSVLPVSAAHAGVFISIAPPPLLTYDQPLCPTDGYLWTPGYWAYDYDAGQYYWVNGVWVPPPRVGYLWTPGYWGYNGGAYAFNEGYWGPTIGFYGGINYGYGYGGYGYYGGRWDGGHFRYNTAITHVNTTVIHNTYVDRNSVHNLTNSRTSFNGKGGLTTRADAAQLAAGRGSHIGATSVQRKVFTQAKTTHANTTTGTGNNAYLTTRTANNGRTTNLSRGNGTNRTALTNNTRSNNRTQLTRGNTTGGNRTNLTRGTTRTNLTRGTTRTNLTRGTTRTN